MMTWMLERSLRGRKVVVAVAAVLTLFAIWQLPSSKIDALPEFAPPTVEIQTEALGLSAPEVEQLITVPLEQDLLAGLPWLETMRSESIPGLSSIELIFEGGTDLLRARQVVQERLTQAAGLPNVSGPPQMLQPLSSTSRIMMVRLSSRTVSPIRMSVLARWTIRPRLLGVQGVANVSIWGQRERQLQVQVDPDKLRRNGLTLDTVIETSGNALWASPLTFLEASTPGTGGFIDTAAQRLGVQHLQPITTAPDLSEVPLPTQKGTSARLGDVARVVEDHQPLIGDAVFSDGVPGLLLVIEKFPGTNTLEVTRDVEAALDALRPGLRGIDVDSAVYRPATYVEQGVSNLGRALLAGAVLLLLVLALMFFDWRTTLTSAVAMVVSLLVAWLALYLSGTAVNTMLLAGLAVALLIVIDDAVLGVEAVARRLRSSRVQGPPSMKAVLEATLEARGGVLYGTLIAAIVVVPLLFLGGRVGPFVPSVLLSYALAVVASMLVALTITPALGLILSSSGSLDRRESPIARALRRGYEHVLTRTVQRPRAMYLGGGLVALAGIAALAFVTLSPLPSFGDGTVLIDWNAVPGTSLPEMDRITSRVGKELSSLPGITEVGAHVGRAITSDQVVGVDSGELWVTVDPDADYAATVDSIRRVVAGYPGIEHAVRTYSDERVAAVLSQEDSPIDVRLYGQDFGILRAKAQQVIDAISGIDGVVHPRTELQPVEPTVNVAVDLQKADRYGIVPGDVRRAAATLMSGIGVGSLFEQQKVFDVVVWGTPGARNSPNSVRDLLIDTPDGGHIRLGQVADVSISSTPTVIQHRDVSRSVDVTAAVVGRDVGDVAADVQARLRDIRFPLEYHAELVRDYADRQAAAFRAVAVGVAVAIGIFVLLQAALASWSLAAVLFLALPLSLVGGAVALLLDDRLVSLGSLLGFFAVYGIAARNGVCLVRHFRHCQDGEHEGLSPSLVIRCSTERLVPIVTSTLAAVAVLLPMVVSGRVAGQEILQPMAYVVVGGLVTVALLTLFLLPSLYLQYGAVEARPADARVAMPQAEQISGA